MVKFLFDKGADLRTGDKKNMSPAVYAKKLNKLEIHALLVRVVEVKLRQLIL